MDDDMIEALRTAAEVADEAYQACTCAYCTGVLRADKCALMLASIAADEALERAEEQAADARRRTYYVLSEDGVSYDCHETLEDAREAAGDPTTGDYDTSDGTVWSDRWIYEVRAESEREAMTLPRERSEHIDTVTVTIDPPEPECCAACHGTGDGTGDDGRHYTGAHDWQAPQEIVGGIAENPGVYGHGGGVVIVECCMRCGCQRTTDTWAQRPDTGEQGLRSVSYDEGYYAAKVTP